MFEWGQPYNTGAGRNLLTPLFSICGLRHSQTGHDIGGDSMDRVQEMMQDNQELIDEEFFDEDELNDVDWVNLNCDYSCVNDILNLSEVS